MKRPEICTCGHVLSVHLDAGRCGNAHCSCLRYDRRNFSDAELEQHERDQLEQNRRALIEQRATEPAPAAAAAAAPIGDTLERIARALEACAAELHILTRPMRRDHPCPKGGQHVYVWSESASDQGPRVFCCRCELPIGTARD
ncbi:MAG TPA: hypothetical protein VJN18_11190 [Polyangiaceae bacterium]|nr:hypothetical protein [Polyangiaceae bacterium]